LLATTRCPVGRYLALTPWTRSRISPVPSSSTRMLSVAAELPQRVITARRPPGNTSIHVWSPVAPSAGSVRCSTGPPTAGTRLIPDRRF
jgi:hypothetical protein